MSVHAKFYARMNARWRMRMYKWIFFRVGLTGRWIPVRTGAGGRTPVAPDFSNAAEDPWLPPIWPDPEAPWSPPNNENPDPDDFWFSDPWWDDHGPWWWPDSPWWDLPPETFEEWYSPCEPDPI